MQNDLDLEQLKKALSKLSPEDRETLMSDVSPDGNSDASVLANQETETVEPTPVVLDQKLASTDLKAQLSLETERVSARHLLSCFPWVVIGFGVLLGLTVILKFIWEQLTNL